MATTAAKAPSVEAILDALRRHPNSTAAELAEAAGIGRSTAGKALAVLEGEGYVIRRDAEPQQGARTAPDRWSLSSGPPAATGDAESQPTADQQPSGGQPASDQPQATEPEPATTEAVTATASEAGAQPADQAAGPRLRPGELRSLVLAWLAGRPGQELTPTKIGKELGRSAGAVGNALATMTDAGEVVQTSAKPRKYMAASNPSEAEPDAETVKAS
jgi:DNA-binding transcriptional MocR family regulator